MVQGLTMNTNLYSQKEQIDYGEEILMSIQKEEDSHSTQEEVSSIKKHKRSSRSSNKSSNIQI